METDSKALPWQEGEIVAEENKNKKNEKEEFEESKIVPTQTPMMRFSLSRLPKILVNWQILLSLLKLLGLFLLALSVLGGVVFGSIKLVKYLKNNVNVKDQKEKTKEAAISNSSAAETKKAQNPPSPTPKPKVKKVRVLDTDLGYLHVRRGAGTSDIKY